MSEQATTSYLSMSRVGMIRSNPLRHTQGDEAMRHRRTSHLARVILLTLPLLLAVAAPVRAQDPITSSMLAPFQVDYNYLGCDACSANVMFFHSTAHVMCLMLTRLTATVACYAHLLADRV